MHRPPGQGDCTGSIRGSYRELPAVHQTGNVRATSDQHMSSRAAHFDLAGIIALEGRGLQLSAVKRTEVSEACLCCSLQACRPHVLLVMLLAGDAKSVAARNWQD